MEKKTTINSCPGNGCHHGCLHRVHVEGGEIVKVERLTYPDGHKDTTCHRAMAGARLAYHSDRLKYPLKRAGNRGEGHWERITWEQALDEIADKLKVIRGEYGPASIGMMTAFNSQSPSTGIHHLLGHRLKNLMQATDMLNSVAIDSNAFFSASCSVGAGFGNYGDSRSLVEGKTKYMIAWGCNPAETAQSFWHYIKEAQKSGAKLVDIGLFNDPTAKAADWFIPVQAGSDGAVALAMIDVIIKQRLYDEDYIVQHTNGPFLARVDNGKLLRESDISPQGSAQNYIVWDAASNLPVVVAPYTGIPAGIKPALTGTYRAGEVECRPAFDLVVDLADRYPPRKAAEISGVSAEIIEKLAREFAVAKPAAILIGWGLRYANSGNAYRAMDILAAITGNTGLMGGGVQHGMISSESALVALNENPVIFADEARASTAPMAHLFERMIAGKPFPMKAMLVYYWNPMHTYPHPRRWTEKAFSNLDLIVVNDIFMTATAEYADYVLPDCTVFEREDVTVGKWGHIVYLDKAIEPMSECRPAIYYWSELARRLGFGDHFDKNIDEWNEIRLKSSHPSIAGIEPPLTLERLKKEKTVRANTPAGVLNPWASMEFPTSSGRIEIYKEDFVPSGDGLPVFREQMESPRSDLAKKYPLVFITANNKWFVHSMFSNEPSILRKYLSEPYLSINQMDAENRGISEGDVVSVYNDRGSLKVKALISETVPPGVVNLPHGWSPKQFIEGHVQNLISCLASPETGDRTREIFWSTVRDKPPVMHMPEHIFAYSPDIIYDCLCEVKRVE